MRKTYTAPAVIVSGTMVAQTMGPPSGLADGGVGIGAFTGSVGFNL